MRTRFAQPEDYEPKALDVVEKVLDLYRDKQKEDLFEAEEDHRQDDPFSNYE